MRLPWWVWLAYADVKFWFLTIPLAIALGLAGWYAAPWLGGLRWVLIAAVILLALPYPAAAAVFIFQTIDSTRYWRTLEVAESIAGLPVPVGSKVRFADKKHSIPVSIELPPVTEISGLRLTHGMASRRDADPPRGCHPKPYRPRATFPTVSRPPAKRCRPALRCGSI
jgi:hypothetical protein